MRYYFHLDGESKGLKQNYVMEDKEHRRIYEAVMTKNSIFKPCTYDFINHVSGSVKSYAMGHNIQKSEGVTVGNSRFANIYDSHFSIDGVNNWEYFESQGYKTDIRVQGLGEVATLSRNGEVVARLESAGKNLFEDESEGKGLANAIHFTGNYRVDCEVENLDIAFMFCFSLTRTSV